MNLVDTSVWVDYLRGRPTVAAERLRVLADAPADIACCEPVAMELLAGADDEAVHARIELLVNGLPTLRLDPALDYRAAAELFRAVRRSGRTVRSLNDCLIAAVALRHDVVVLHKDADFDALAAVSALRTESLR